MPSKIGSIFVDLGLRTATFQKRLKQASSNLSRNVRKMKDGLRSMAKPITLITGLLGGLGAVSFTALIRSTLSSADALAKHADRLGLTTEALGGLRFAAEQTGSEVSGLDVGLQRMVRRIADAEAGNKGLRQTLQELNLEVSSLAALSPDQQFIAIADAISKIPNQGERVRQTFKLFDTEGVKLKNLLDTGGDGVRELIREFESLGGAISRVDAAKMEMANDAINRMKVSFTGLTNQLAIQFAPLLTVIAEKLSGAAVEGNGLGAALERVIGIGVTGFGWMANGLHFLKIGVGAIITGFFKLNEAVYKGRALFMDFAASALEGLESLRAGLVEISQKVAKVIEGVVNRVGNFVVDVINAVLSKVSDMVNGAINILIDGVNSIAEYVPGMSQMSRVNFSAGQVSRIEVKLVDDGPENEKSSIQKMAEAARRSARDLRGQADVSGAIAESVASDTRGLVNSELPSERLKRGFEEMKAKSQEAAEKIAENARKNQQGLGATEEAAGKVAGAVGKIGKAAGSSKEKLAKMSDEAKSKLEEVQDRARSVTQNMTSAFESFVDSGKLSFKGLVDSIARDLTKLAARNAITNGLGGKGFLGGVLGGFGKLFGVGVAGARADGGPVTGGKTYLVGERGPELFKAGTSGTIIPNESLRATKSSGNQITIHEHNNIQPGVSREELRITLEEMARVRDEQRRQMIQSGEAAFAGLVEA